MADTMFHDVVDPSIKLGGKTARTVVVSVLVHTAIVGTLVVVPVLSPARVLPTPPLVLAFTAAPSPPAIPPAPPLMRRGAVAQRRIDIGDPAVPPPETPAGMAPESLVEDNRGRLGAIEGGTGLVPGGLAGEHVALPPPPRDSPKPEPIPQAPLRPGGRIRQPKKVKDVRPIYPIMAQAAHVEGIVIIEATIGPSGNVADARVLRSNPLLDAAALDAVRKWEFTPTLLNGTPVPIVMTVTVDFRLR